MRVPVAVRRVANCYTPFTYFTYLLTYWNQWAEIQSLFCKLLATNFLVIGERVWILRGSKIALSHWQSQLPLTQGWPQPLTSWFPSALRESDSPMTQDFQQTTMASIGRLAQANTVCSGDRLPVSLQQQLRARQRDSWNYDADSSVISVFVTFRRFISKISGGIHTDRRFNGSRRWSLKNINTSIS